MLCVDGQPAGPSGCGSGAGGATAGGAPAAGAGGVGGSVITGGGAGGAGIGAAAGAGGVAGSALPMAGAGGAGSGGAGGGDAGSGGMAGSAGTGSAGSGADELGDCGEGGMVGKASNDDASPRASGYGNVRFSFAASNHIVRLRTTLEVPVEPDGNTTLFIWPGLEPLQGGENYSPIGTGVLQPVLTWGGSCAPGSPQSLSGDHWWISAQYVNTLGNDPGHTGCRGGDVLEAEIGDQLLIDMSLNGSIWNQTITNQAGTAVDFEIDLEDQAQRWALFEIEMPTSTRPASDIVFTNTLITLAEPEPDGCQPSTRGTNDYFSAPIASSDGLRCCIARLVLREQGVDATTMDPAP